MTTSHETLTDLQRDAAERLTGARELAEVAYDLACIANRGEIPAPDAYALIGALTSTLARIEEIIAHLPSGLRQSLSDRRIILQDYDPDTRQPRDPARQIAAASQFLTTAETHLARTYDHLSSAQGALREQWYEAV